MKQNSYQICSSKGASLRTFCFYLLKIGKRQQMFLMGISLISPNFIKLSIKCFQFVRISSNIHTSFHTNIFMYLENCSQSLNVGFGHLGYFCATHPATVLCSGLLVTVALGSGLAFYQITTDPVELWSSPTSQGISIFLLLNALRRILLVKNVSTQNYNYL